MWVWRNAFTLSPRPSLCRQVSLLLLSLMEGDRSRFLMRLRIVPLPSAFIAPDAAANAANRVRQRLDSFCCGAASASAVIPPHSRRVQFTWVLFRFYTDPNRRLWFCPCSAFYFSAASKKRQTQLIRPDWAAAPPASTPRAANVLRIPVRFFQIKLYNFKKWRLTLIFFNRQILTIWNSMFPYYIVVWLKLFVEPVLIYYLCRKLHCSNLISVLFVWRFSLFPVTLIHGAADRTLGGAPTGD